MVTPPPGALSSLGSSSAPSIWRGAQLLRMGRGTENRRIAKGEVERRWFEIRGKCEKMECEHAGLKGK
jgi:hypothetical protein